MERKRKGLGKDEAGAGTEGGVAVGTKRVKRESRKTRGIGDVDKKSKKEEAERRKVCIFKQARYVNTDVDTVATLVPAHSCAVWACISPLPFYLSTSPSLSFPNRILFR